jgi:hypothetical protein
MAKPTWENPIKSFFRKKDIDSMKPKRIDLSSYDDVKKRAQDIYERLADGSMPCDGEWPADRIATFKEWVDNGAPKS